MRTWKVTLHSCTMDATGTSPFMVEKNTCSRGFRGNGRSQHAGGRMQVNGMRHMQRWVTRFFYAWWRDARRIGGDGE